MISQHDAPLLQARAYLGKSSCGPWPPYLWHSFFATFSQFWGYPFMSSYITRFSELLITLHFGVNESWFCDSLATYGARCILIGWYMVAPNKRLDYTLGCQRLCAHWRVSAGGDGVQTRISCRGQTRATRCITTNNKISKRSRDHNHAHLWGDISSSW